MALSAALTGRPPDYDDETLRMPTWASSSDCGGAAAAPRKAFGRSLQGLSPSHTSTDSRVTKPSSKHSSPKQRNSNKRKPRPLVHASQSAAVHQTMPSAPVGHAASYQFMADYEPWLGVPSSTLHLSALPRQNAQTLDPFYSQPSAYSYAQSEPQFHQQLYLDQFDPTIQDAWVSNQYLASQQSAQHQFNAGNPDFDPQDLWTQPDFGHHADGSHDAHRLASWQLPFDQDGNPVYYGHTFPRRDRSDAQWGAPLIAQPALPNFDAGFLPTSDQVSQSVPAPEPDLVGVGLYDDKRSANIFAAPEPPVMLSSSAPSMPRKSLVLEAGWQPPPTADDLTAASSDDDDFSIDDFYSTDDVPAETTWNLGNLDLDFDPDLALEDDLILSKEAGFVDTNGMPVMPHQDYEDSHVYMDSYDPTLWQPRY